jgi:hypothetical protein
VTDKRAVLWTDGRYYLQANLQLDCQWTLMQPGDDKVCRFFYIQCKFVFFPHRQKENAELILSMISSSSCTGNGD